MPTIIIGSPAAVQGPGKGAGLAGDGGSTDQINRVIGLVEV